MNYEEGRILELERRVGLLQLDLFNVAQSLAQSSQYIKQAFPLGGACWITFAFTVTDSVTSADIVGAAVDVFDSGSVLVASGVTDSSGFCSLAVFVIDTYTYSVSDSGYTTATGSCPSVLCGDVDAIPVSLVPSSCSVTFTGHLEGCNSFVIIGSVVTAFTHPGGVSIGSGTSNGSGDFSITGSMPVADTSIDIQVTSTRYDPVVGNFAASCGSNSLGTITATPSASYVCNNFCDNTLGVDVLLSFHGGATDSVLSYDGTNWVGVSSQQAGIGFTATYTWDGASSLTVANWHYAPSGIPIMYLVGGGTLPLSSSTCPSHRFLGVFSGTISGRVPPITLAFDISDGILP